MRQSLFTILTNDAIAPDVMRMTLTGDTDAVTEPGQFVNIRLSGLYLRRPLSVCMKEDQRLTLVYKVVGEGTAMLSRMTAGGTIDMLTGLGHGFDIRVAGAEPLLIGGGLGTAPLLWLARELGGRCQVVLGFNSASDIILEHDFRQLGCDVTITTADGSVGTSGFVTDALPTHYSHYYACGPQGMLQAIVRAAHGDGQVSLEERMGCGWGVCVGCSVKTTEGDKKVCHDGPVFRANEITWK